MGMKAKVETISTGKDHMASTLPPVPTVPTAVVAGIDNAKAGRIKAVELVKNVLSRGIEIVTTGAVLSKVNVDPRAEK